LSGWWSSAPAPGALNRRIQLAGAGALGHAPLVEENTVVGHQSGQDQEVDGERAYRVAESPCTESTRCCGGCSGCVIFPGASGCVRVRGQEKSPAEGRALLHIRIQASDLVSTPDRRGTPHTHTMALALALCQLLVGALLAGHAGARRWFLILPSDFVL